jgi:Tfp pilus assembly protein PilN
VKALHTNLASRPYRDYRPVYFALVAMAVLTGFIMVNNIQTAYDYFANTKTTRGEIAALEASIEQERRQAEALDAQINRIDFKGLNEQIRYVNLQIAERSFSWSGLLSDLERVVPKDVRLTELNPSIDKDGGVTLKINAVSRKPGGLVAMLNMILEDPHFAKPMPQGEQRSETGDQTFGIVVEYKPTPEVLR